MRSDQITTKNAGVTGIIVLKKENPWQHVVCYNLFMEGGEGSTPQIRGSLVPKPEGKLRGTLLQIKVSDSKPSTSPSTGKEAESSHIQYLNDVIAPLAREYGGFERVLGGSSALSMEGNFQLNTYKFSKDPKNNYPRGPRLRLGVAHTWNTGVNLDVLATTLPNERYKFYLSLDLSTPDKVQRAQQMFGKILELAKKEKISLLSKSEDHTYDSLDLYTWDRKKLEDVIKAVYSQYPDIWLTTHHFFQAPIEGINPMYVGWVQEPLGGKDGNSHSDRMGILGKTIDIGGKDKVDTELFEQACKNASVNPSAPWLVFNSH